MHLLLIRHAECRTGTRDDDDLGLTFRGVEQASLLAEWLQGKDWRVDVLLSSRLPRAWQTAETLASRLGIPVVPEARLQEVGSCDCEGQPLPAGAAPPHGFHPLADRERPVRPGGETWNQFLDRVAGLLRDILAVYGTMRDRHVLLVCHSGVHNAVHQLLCAPRGVASAVELAVGHTGISHWEYGEGAGPEPWVLRAHNVAEHLLAASPSARREVEPAAKL